MAFNPVNNLQIPGWAFEPASVQGQFSVGSAGVATSPMLSLLPPPVTASIGKREFFPALTSGANNLGSPPAGYRWVVYGIFVQNCTNSALTYLPQFKDALGYPWNPWSVTPTSVPSGGFSGITAFIDNGVSWPILESSDSVIVTCSGSGFSVLFSYLEFPVSTRLKSVKTYPVTGNNVLYTCPPGFTALPVYWAGSNWAIALSGAYYMNYSGTSKTISSNFVVSGGSIIAPGVASSNAILANTVVANNVSHLVSNSNGLPSPAYMQPGDFFSLSVSSGTAPQIAYVTVAEIPLPS